MSGTFGNILVHIVVIFFPNAQKFLQEYFYNDQKYIQFLHDIETWALEKFQLENLEDRLSTFFRTIYGELIIHTDDEKFNLPLRMSLECIFFHHLHDEIMPLIYEHCECQDSQLFQKCIEFSDNNVTAEQFGAKEDFGIPLYAGIVELANLDNRKTPLEKLNCLCTTYDLLYAELKCALAEFFSETSDADNDIPIVENWDIIPVLMTVIVKSKLLHLYSNFYYINMFLWTCTDTENVNHILNMFRLAIEKIFQESIHTLKPSSVKNCKELDLKTTFEIINEVGSGHQVKKTYSLLDLQRRKIAEQIILSTNT